MNTGNRRGAPTRMSLSTSEKKHDEPARFVALRRLIDENSARFLFLAMVHRFVQRAGGVAAHCPEPLCRNLPCQGLRGRVPERAPSRILPDARLQDVGVLGSAPPRQAPTGPGDAGHEAQWRLRVPAARP